jgi:uncharacterized protein YwbE
MSSSDQKKININSEAVIDGAVGFIKDEKVRGFSSIVLNYGVRLLQTGKLPIGATANGLLWVGKKLAYTTVGRIIVLLSLSALLWGLVEGHFTKAENNRWQAVVINKQSEINSRVKDVNIDTKRDQESSQLNRGYIKKILDVVVDGIWKTQPAHPIESETIDLINQTRGSKK